MKNNIKNLLVVIIILFALPTFAQEQEPKQLGDEEISVVKAYKPVLSEATRISSLPEGDTSHQVITPQTYNVAANKISTNIEITPIKALKVKDEVVSRLNSNYIKLGYGNYNTPYGEFFLNSLRNKDLQAGVHLKHQSGNADLNDNYKSSIYSQNEIEAYGKRFYEKETIGASVQYARQAYNFYGYNADLYAPSAITTSAQVFNDFNLKVSLADNTQGKKQLYHTVNLHYNYYSDNYKARENTVLADLNVKTKTDFADLGLKGAIDFTNNVQPNGSGENRAIIILNPYVSGQMNILSLTAGLNSNIEAGAVSGFRLYPQLEATASVIDNFMTAYAIMDGCVEKNTLRALTITNPFINTQLNLQNTRTFEIKGGLRGSFSHSTTYNAGIAWQSVANMPLYVADTTFKVPTRFTVIYDDATVIILHAEVGHRLNDKWSLITHAQFSNYSMATEQKAWYLSTFVYTLGTIYSLTNQILVHADVFVNSTRYYKVYLPIVQAKSLSGIVDVNIGGEYRYTKAFSLFLNFNNIGAVNYYKWENYPTQRFQVLGGLTYSF